jgi:hypothetical protein
LTIKNCRDLFIKDEFFVNSTPIDLVGFKWLLAATTEEKGFLSLFLHVVPPKDFNGNYRIEVDLLVIFKFDNFNLDKNYFYLSRFSVLNAFAFAGMDLNKEYNRVTYTRLENNHTGKGYPDMAKFEVNLE